MGPVWLLLVFVVAGAVMMVMLYHVLLYLAEITNRLGMLVGRATGSRRAADLVETVPLALLAWGLPVASTLVVILQWEQLAPASRGFLVIFALEGVALAALLSRFLLRSVRASSIDAAAS